MKYLPRFVSIEARRSNDISDCQAASLHMEIQFVLHQLRIPWRLRLTMHAKPYNGNTETNNLKLKLRKLRALFQVLERKRRTERENGHAPIRRREIASLISHSFGIFLSTLFPFFSLFLPFRFLRLLSLLSDQTLQQWKNSLPILSDVKINLYTNEWTLSTRISRNRWCHASKQKLVTSFKYFQY